MKITAALLTTPKQPFGIETLDLAPPREGELLVRMAAVGVCHSDWHLVTGATRHPMPVVAGHEGAGVIEAVGPGVPPALTPGTRVILNWAPACGACFYCTHLQPNLCETFTGPIWQGQMLDGTTRLSHASRPVYHWCGLAAFATHTVVPHQSVVPYTSDVPTTVAALIGCAVATGVGAVTHSATGRESIAVVGCGGVGLSALMGASSLKFPGPIIGIDANPAKERMARSCGATEFVVAQENWPDRVRALTNGRGADLVIEAVGLPATQEQSFAATRPGGTLVLAGLSAMGSATNLPGAIITRQEKTIKGSYYGSCDPTTDFPTFLTAYATGRLPLDRLVSQHYRLHQINEAYAQMLTGDGGRGVIVF